MNYSKIFCIGFNKTGTTSLGNVLQKYGFILGSQLRGEHLFYKWLERKWDNIFSLCNTADAFQDVPFSLPYTYQALDLEYPDALFILSVRDNSEQWYNSLVRFHSKKFNKGNLPTYEILRQRRPNGIIPWDFYLNVYGSTNEHIYNQESFKQAYNTHNDNVIKYFKHKPNKLLVINLKDSDSSVKLSKFLNFAKTIKIPHLNRSI